MHDDSTSPGEPAAHVPTTAPARPDAGDDYRLHPALPRRWGIVATLVVVPIAVVGCIVAVALGFVVLVPVVIALAAGLVVVVRAYARRYLATFRCVLSDLGLYVERGVWWRSQTFVPRHRVQHTDVDQGPLARRWGVATLKVFTAGSSVGEIQVDDLAHADALRLRDLLLERPTS